MPGCHLGEWKPRYYGRGVRRQQPGGQHRGRSGGQWSVWRRSDRPDQRQLCGDQPVLGQWKHYDAGAVTWGNGTSGTTGVVSAANSLVGSTADDQVGGDYWDGGVIMLTNGNYVVSIPQWDNGSIDGCGRCHLGEWHRRY